MSTRKLTAACGLGLAALAALPAQAQGQGVACAPRESVIEQLAESYGESRQAVGLGANNVVVEVFASLETGTWTITVTRPGGPTCLVASGQAYESLDEDMINTDQDA